jgi:D-arabinitol dehydrogenase (NADP+)
MNAAVITQPQSLAIQDRDTPEPEPGEVLIRVRASGICGTDIHIYQGEYMGSYPIVPGHEFAGDVVAVGAAVTRISVGDRVAVEPNIACGNCSHCLSNRQNFCRNWTAVGVTRSGGMAEYVTAPEQNVFPVGDLPYEEAAFVEPLSCVLHGLAKTVIDPGDRVSILGSGPIGCLLLQCARLSGAGRITVVERSDTRRAMALEMGADEAYDDVARVPEESQDTVIDASGAIPLMKEALRLARKGGRILYFGVTASDAAMELEPFVLFQKGLSIAASFTSVRNSLQAVRLLQSGQVDVARLISHQRPLAELEDAILSIRDGAPGVMKVMMRP